MEKDGQQLEAEVQESGIQLHTAAHSCNASTRQVQHEKLVQDNPQLCGASVGPAQAPQKTLQNTSYCFTYKYHDILIFHQ